MTLKVGDTIYRIERYRRAGDAKWHPYVIKGETKQSWLVGTWSADIKVNKKTMLTKTDFRGQNDRYYTQEGMVGEDFREKHARNIGAAVQTCKDTEKLKKIAEIIGMELK